MATPPTFTAGSVLTAAQMNAVGLWRITSCTVTSAGGTAATASNGVVTIGTNNTSITVANAFSADYENYKIILAGGVGSANGNIQLQIGNAVTGYYGICIYGPYTATTVTNLPANNGANMAIMGGYDTTFAEMTCEILSPYLAKPTIGNAFIMDTSNQGFSVYRLANTTSYTDFKIICSTGNLTGGSIRVYGYNK